MLDLKLLNSCYQKLDIVETEHLCNRSLMSVGGGLITDPGVPGLVLGSSLRYPGWRGSQATLREHKGAVIFW